MKMRAAVFVAAMMAVPVQSFAACSTAQLAGQWHLSTTLTECDLVSIDAKGRGRGVCVTYAAPGSYWFDPTWNVAIRAIVLPNCDFVAVFTQQGKPPLSMRGRLQIASGAPSWVAGRLSHYGPFNLGPVD